MRHVSGKTISRRLYGLKQLPSRIRRARYFRGHGVHSPYVYAIVRKVFMRSTLIGDGRELYDELSQRGISHRRAVQLQNLFTHCGYAAFGIDCVSEPVDMAIVTLDVAPADLTAYADAARRSGSTLCIMTPYYSAERSRACAALVAKHPCTSVDNRGYLLLFNNHLPRQRFKL